MYTVSRDDETVTVRVNSDSISRVKKLANGVVAEYRDDKLIRLTIDIVGDPSVCMFTFDGTKLTVAMEFPDGAKLGYTPTVDPKIQVMMWETRCVAVVLT